MERLANLNALLVLMEIKNLLVSKIRIKLPKGPLVKKRGRKYGLVCVSLVHHLVRVALMVPMIAILAILKVSYHITRYKQQERVSAKSHATLAMPFQLGMKISRANSVHRIVPHVWAL